MRTKYWHYLSKIIATLVLAAVVYYIYFSHQMIFSYYDVSPQERLDLLHYSKSQLKQDIFVYLESHKKKNGFFVEFGATNGIKLSNSYMLELQYGWRGILAEPALIWHQQLKSNRPYSTVVPLCVWKTSGSKMIFNETARPEWSTLKEFSSSDRYDKFRVNGKHYAVATISLLDLLKTYHAPQHVDYLSVDTEGSELEILEAYFRDNKRYKIQIITVEHNFTANRGKIYQLLTKHGYVRKYPMLSIHDDFYVLKSTEYNEPRSGV